MLKKIILFLLCAVMLVGCTEDTSEDIQPTGTTRNPKEEAKLRRILDAAVAEGITQPTTTSYSEVQAIEDYEKNRSELIRLNPIVENLDFDGILSISEDLILIYKNRKYGFINKYGEEVIPPTYVEAQQFNENLAAVRNDRKKWGYIDKEGTLVIPFQYDRASVFNGGLASVGIFDGRKMGYINTSGEIVIPLVYDETFAFNDGYAVVRQGNKYGAIDPDNNIIIPLEYDYIGPFLGGEAVFYDDNGKCGLINTRGEIILSEIIIPALYESILLVRGSDYLFFVSQDRKAALMNKNGEFITDFIFNVYDSSGFNEGLAVVYIENELCYIDEAGKIILRLSRGIIGSGFKNGVAIVHNENSGNGLIDKIGKPVLPCIYNQIANLGEGLIAVQRYTNGTWTVYEIEEIK